MESLTDFVLDTMALVKHLEDDLPRAADKAFRDAEAGRSHMYLPEIALGEFIYVALRGRLRVSDVRSTVEEVVDQILATSYITISQLSHQAWDIFMKIDLSELHDRMIAADALARRAPVITNDQEIVSLAGLRTVWR